MNPTTKYGHSVNLEDPNSSHARMLSLVGTHKSVLEFGCSSGYMSRALRERGCHVVGIELDPQAAAAAREFCDRVIIADAESDDWMREVGDATFDVIVAGDVLEHLKNPLRLLQRIRPLIAPDGCVVASIPNIAHGSVRLALLGGEFEYRSLGLLDETHLRFFTRSSIQEMFAKAGYRVLELQRATAGIFEVEIKPIYEELPAGLVSQLERDEDAETYQFICKAVPHGTEDLIATVFQELRSSQKENRRLQANLQKERERVTEQQEHAAVLNTAIQERDRVLEAKEKTLQALLNSKGWRTLNALREVRSGLRSLLRSGAAAEGSGFQYALDKSLTEKLVVGLGNTIYLSGWAFHPGSRIKRLEILINGVAFRLKWHGIPRIDVFEMQDYATDPNGSSLYSGFFGFIPIPKSDDAFADLTLRAKLANGNVFVEKLGSVLLQQNDSGPQPMPPSNTEKKPLIAICMATYNPPLDLFRRQVQSILGQTHSNWTCVISDDCSDPDTFRQMTDIVDADPRFRIIRSGSRLGFYHNFERCLTLAPSEAEFLALCDQDDFWHQEKLEMLLAQFKPGVNLVYSDVNIVDRNGTLIANTYWTTRPNNYRKLGSLVMANTITGAASLFRRSLLSYALPFPQRIGEPFHDHWIGAVALSMGDVGYVNRPLHDYVQHSSAVLGHCAPERQTWLQALRARLKKWAQIDLRTTFAHWKSIYFYDLLRIQLLCRILELRCSAILTAKKRKELARVGSADERFVPLVWLTLRALGGTFRVTETIGAEGALLRGIAWKKCTQFRSWLKRYRKVRTAQTDGRVLQQSRPQALGLDRVAVIEEKIAPLNLKISQSAPTRLNLLVPTIDLNYFFGGYITKFNLAKSLAKHGLRVRIVIVDHCHFLPSVWQQQLKAYQGLEDLFSHVELAYAHDRSVPLEVSSGDSFIASTWWTAHIGHRASAELGRKSFLYLIQEYEPFTFAMGTFSALAAESYSFPHCAIFSTEFLRDYFRQNRIGVYQHSVEKGDHRSISFQNAITAVGEVSAAELAQRTSKKLLFYARPEQHAARNMFELGILALSRAIRSGQFGAQWEFFGIGSVGSGAKLELANGFHMKLLPRQSQQQYRELLRAHDLGLSLMYTPHPSLVPIEMASAGMLTVTNTFSNKTSCLLRSISPNLLAVEPTLASVEEGLRQAVAGIENYEQRAQGSLVKWSTDWKQSFNDSTMMQMKNLMEMARE